MNKSQLDADPKLVWRICFYLRDLKGCQKCGPEMIGEDLCTRGCYAKAEEVINIAQTGNAWRRGETTPKDPEALVKALEPDGTADAFAAADLILAPLPPPPTENL